MNVEFMQNIIDVIKGEKEIKFVEKITPVIPKSLNKKTGMFNPYAICFDYKDAKKIIDKNKNRIKLMGFYDDRDEYIAKNDPGLGCVYNGQKKFIYEHVMPLIKPTDVICDVGCASGEFTYMFAPKCKHIDGIEYFQKYVDVGNKHAQEQRISNIHFSQGDIKKYSFSKKYNHILFMGVLPHILDEQDIEPIINKLYSALNEGGYLTIKCNVTNNDFNIYKIGLNHSVVHYSKQKLSNYLANQGFSLVCSQYIMNSQMITLPELDKTVFADYIMAVYKKK